MEKSFDLLIKIVDEVKSNVSNMTGTVHQHDKQLEKIVLQLETLSEHLQSKRDRTVWIKRAFLGAIISSGVGAVIGWIVFLIKGG